MQRKAYRDSFVASHVSETVAAQIALLRSARGWTQTLLAEKTGMKQPRISALEDPNYENYEIGTLKRIASAYDVGLSVRFVPFSEIVRWSSTLGPHRFTVSDFENDSVDSMPQTTSGSTANIIDPLPETSSVSRKIDDCVYVGRQ